ncbi:helix-turn-helix domain-containing protein [Citrobacter freundii]|uniref:helix-turn-helix domain-containing protein n=1 Tax=Citrobacter freundii TaxID=546 RepID=UPI003A88611C
MASATIVISGLLTTLVNERYMDMQEFQNKTRTVAVGKKIREIRNSEGLTRKQFFEATGILEETQKLYELGRRKNIGVDTLLKITCHPRFKKYTLWLMTGDPSAVSEQIAPVSSPGGKNDDQ